MSGLTGMPGILVLNLVEAGSELVGVDVLGASAPVLIKKSNSVARSRALVGVFGPNGPAVLNHAEED